CPSSFSFGFSGSRRGARVTTRRMRCLLRSRRACPSGSEDDCMAVSPADAARFVARTLGRTSLGTACVRALVALRRTGRIDPARAMTLARWIMETPRGTLPLVSGEIELVGRRVRLYSNLKTASGRALLIPPGPCQGEDASLLLFAALARGARVVFDVGA